MAYPTFETANRQIHKKDYFMRGLHPELQLRLKILVEFSGITMKNLVANAVRLETAGVRSTGHNIKTEINEVNSDHVLHDVEEQSSNKKEQSIRRNNQLEERLDGLEELVAKLSDSKVTR